MSTSAIQEINGEQLAPAIVRYNTQEHGHLLQSCKKIESLFSHGRTNFGGNGRSTFILNLEYKNTEDTAALSSYAHAVCQPFLDNYCKQFGVPNLRPETQWLALKYATGDFFDTHFDDLPDIHRTVSAVMYLNKDYKGGELSFPYFGVSLVPEPGDVLIFPSSYAYTHRVSTILEGIRYSLVNWYMI